ncbi:MAG: SusD/RagB family nutrient-binding outer membrane lipoprotein [Marinifilaceae bacterium]
MMRQYVCAVLLALVTTACGDWLDVNTSKDVPTVVPGEMVLPSAQLSLSVVLGGELSECGGFFAQYWVQSPEQQQYMALNTYDLKNTYLNTSYESIYADVLMDCKVIKEGAATKRSSLLNLMATTIRVYALQLMVDAMDKAPYSEALMGNEIIAPRWDNGDEIYKGLIKELDDAIAWQRRDETPYVTKYDMLLECDEESWIRFANSLKLKLLMRQSLATSAFDAIIDELIAEDEFIEEDVCFNRFSDEPNKQNPWYTTNRMGLNRINHVASSSIIQSFLKYDDVRLGKQFDLNAKNEFAGFVPGYAAAVGRKREEFSVPLAYKWPTRAVYLLTCFEVAFFKAEWALRKGDNDAAKQEYEQGVTESFRMWRLAGEERNYLSSEYRWENYTTYEECMEAIGVQKWLALSMVNHFEAWCEIRRLGYPRMSDENGQNIDKDITLLQAGELIDPIDNALGKRKYMNRLPYPASAALANSNTPKQPGNETKVWWDIN